MHTDSLPVGDRDNATDIAEEPRIESNAENAMHTGKYAIPGDVVNKATAELPENQRSAIRKLHIFYSEHQYSLAELGEIVGLSTTTLTHTFRGKYRARLDGVVEKIEKFFQIQEERSKSQKLKFIPTKLSQRIAEICHNAVMMQKINFIFGDSQVGKSAALRHYRDEHNHGSTIYLEMPTGGRLTDFMAKLAHALRISAHQRKVDLRRRLIESFDDRMLLIVDEAHQCIPVNAYTTARSLQSIEFIREIYNERECGVVICATNTFRDEMEKGDFSRLLAQTKRRQFLTLQLPDAPTTEDLNIFAKAYDLPPAEGKALDLQTRIIAGEALGYWLSVLRAGQLVANEAKQKMQWAHVITAHAGLLKLQGKK